MADFGLQGAATLTDMLHNAGYVTGHFGKWLLGRNITTGMYGIDHLNIIPAMRSHPGGRDGRVFERSLDFIEQHKDEPFYINIWGHITHFPINPQPQFEQQFLDIKVDRSDFGKYMQDRFDQSEQIALERDSNAIDSLDRSMRKYLSDLYTLDLQVGELMKTLDRLGLSENTIIAFAR